MYSLILGENDWQIVPKVYVGPPIRKINWGGGNKYLAINSVRQAFILTEQVGIVLIFFFGGGEHFCPDFNLLDNFLGFYL